MSWYRAVALDLDGTLTAGGWPAETLLRQIDRVRSDGLRVLLVTGRILSQLDVEFPGLADHFDVVVAENGCVLRTTAGSRTLAEPVDDTLLQRLHAAGLLVRRGEVLLDTYAGSDHVVLDAVESLGLDVQLVRNRNALMLLPAGVTKGTGLREALAELGISPHNTIAVGDAENDHAMLAVAGLGVAVANAVESLRRRADLVLDAPDGTGVLGLLQGPVLGGERRVSSPRHRLVLGHTPDGRPVTVPSSRTCVLVTGGTESGKSDVTGLLVEQLVAQAYAVLVVDPEGDHLTLGSLRTVSAFTGPSLPGPTAVATSASAGDGTVLLDLSHLPAEARATYLDELWPALAVARAATSRPHWLVLEEAHDVRLPLTGPEIGAAFDGGLCLVSYRAEDIEPALLERVEWEVSLSEGGSREALLIPPAGERVPFRAGARSTPHVRHWHKYLDAELSDDLVFTFRTGDGAVQARATNLRDFVAALETASAEVVQFHAGRGDFSRWLAGVYRDHVLASLVATAEHDLVAHGDPARTQRLLVELVGGRYRSAGQVEPVGTPLA
ncbi:MAG: hypothetical protein JWP61_2500 [Friedmanniella sp.]|nr:hypothetical protein [Friedmanniella sp.]